jgi:hypothetical protein
MAASATRFELADRRLRRAVAEGDVVTARTELATLLFCARNASSSKTVTSCFMSIAHAAPMLISANAQAGRTLAEHVLRIAEPWFEADVDDFIEVAQDTRHIALHALMHACARQRDFATARFVLRADDECNERCFRRWLRLAIPSSPGTHAHYRTAYGTAQLIALMSASETFSDVPALLDTLETLTSRVVTDDDPEVRDAYANEEIAALRAVIDAGAPPDLKARCLARRDAVRVIAAPPEAWPRTHEALAAEGPQPQ